jgi:hypothetical protein
VSREYADAFSQKLVRIALESTRADRQGARRTPLSEAELNSWFAYHAQPLIPQGITEPTITIIGNGRIAGRAVVDMDAVAKNKATGGMLDPWSYVGGKMPVFVTGTLHTGDGVGRFEVATAEVSGVPVPKPLLAQLVAYYSRTPEDPDGIDMDAPFELPANISRIELGEGQAVVVQ